MRTTINIEDGLLEVAKRRANRTKNSLSAVLNEALRTGLLRTEESPTAQTQRPLQTFRGDGVRPGVDLNDSRDMLEIMERR